MGRLIEGKEPQSHKSGSGVWPELPVDFHLDLSEQFSFVHLRGIKKWGEWGHSNGAQETLRSFPTIPSQQSCLIESKDPRFLGCARGPYGIRE